MNLLSRKLTYLQSLLLLVVYILPQEAGSQASRSREGCFNSTPDLGMARGTIPDSDITASSMINSDSHPHFARLGNSKAWTADRNDLTPWIQVNLQKAINVTAIATQGFSGSYVRQYYLSYSVSGNQWMNYTTQGVTKVFQANQNDAMLATVVLNPLVVAQYIRLHPTNCSKFCALRMELYGCNSTAGFPGRPPAPTVSSTSATSISIQWNAPDEVGDGIRGYHVRWQEEGASSPEQKVVTSGRVTILDKLTPYTWYTIQVQPYNNKGVGLWSEELRVRSNESVPSVAPGNFKLGSSSSLSLDVSWDAIHAEQQQGKLLGYRIVYRKNGSEVNHTKDVGPNQYSYKIEKLEYASYAVKVAGYTRVGVGKFTEPKSRFPNEGVPSKPINIKAKLEDGSITVFWEKPADPNGIITRYEVYCKGTRSYNISFQTNNQMSEPSTSRFARFSKAKLSPGTKFTMYVTAFTVKGEGDKSHHSVVETPSTAPPPPPPPLGDDDDVTATTITISLMLSPDINGKVIAHEVVVGKLEKVTKRSTKSLGHNLFGYEEAKENGDELYIAAKFDRGKITNQAEFVLGDGKTYGEYKNVPLEPKTNYIVYVRGITEDDGKWIYGDAAYTILPTTDSTESTTSATDSNKDAQQREENDPKIAVVAACLGAVLFLALIGLAVVLVLRRKRRRGKDAEKPKMSCSKQSEPQYESVEPAAEAARLLEKHEVNITANSQKEQPKVESEYAVVNKANKKPKKGDLVYAQLAEFDDTNSDVKAAEKPATYEPTVYAEVVASDVYHEASPDSSQPTYENVKNSGV